MLKFKLKHYMDLKGISISEMSRLTNLSRNSITSLSSGKTNGIRFDNLEKISNILDVSIGDLFEKTIDKVELSIVTNEKSKTFLNLKIDEIIMETEINPIITIEKVVYDSLGFQINDNIIVFKLSFDTYFENRFMEILNTIEGSNELLAMWLISKLQDFTNKNDLPNDIEHIHFESGLLNSTFGIEELGAFQNSSNNLLEKNPHFNYKTSNNNLLIYANH